MADAVTVLRELSFGYGILKQEIEDFKETPVKFLDFCQENIKNCQDLTTKSFARRKLSFSEEEKEIIQEGLSLAKHVLSKDLIESAKPNVEWIESKIKSGSAINVIVDEIPFTLKKENFIIDDMDLYTLINIIVDEVIYKRDFHIFEDYASEELDTWFKVVRDLIIEKGKQGSFQIKDNRGRIIKLSYSESVDKLFLFFANNDEIIEEFTACDYKRFDASTSSKYRENVLARFLNKELCAHPDYLKYKKLCLEKAGENLVSFLKEKVQTNKSINALYTLFKIEEKPYYFAQMSEDGAELYKIPSQEEFTKNVKITEITSLVPKAHLKIYTSIENTKTTDKLVITNKIKYPHGAFNGVPESKMSIETGSLLIAYDKI